MKKLAMVVAVLLAAGSANAENLLTNPGLETHPGDGWDWTDMGWAHWGSPHTDWAARSGGRGGALEGWGDTVSTNWGGVYQDIASTGGVYTFTIWLRREATNFALRFIDLKLEWKDAGYNDLGTAARRLDDFPADDSWHQVHITATGTLANTAFVRPVLFVEWLTLTNGGLGMTYDDAELYEGAYTGATAVLLNPSFEMCSQFDGWRGTYWSADPDALGLVSDGFVDWARRLGARGAVMRGWYEGKPVYTSRISQAVSPGTGTYTFAIWMKNLMNFWPYTSEVQIAWYDAAFTNLLGMAVTNFMVPHDNDWHEYFITAEITNTDVFEVRPSVFVGWYENTTDQYDRAMMMDDARFFRGAYTPWTTPVEGFDRIYFNGDPGTVQPQAELVPKLGVPFLDYHYEPDSESYLHVLSPKGALSAMRGRFYFGSGGGQVWRDGAWYTNIVIESTNQFHGAPIAGDMTMDVWRVTFYPPANWMADMWYAPVVKLQETGVEWWLAAKVDDPVITSGFTGTNNWPNNPQRFWSQVPYDHDWYFGPTGRVSRTGVTLDWAYYNHTNFNPATEVIPAMDGTSTFLQVNYATTTTTFYILVDKPLKQLLPDERSEVLMRTSWERPPAGSEDWVTDYNLMTWVSNLVLDAGAAFHGLPGSGQHTVDLWRLTWTQPLTPGGVPYTDAIVVYHAPLLKAVFGPDNYITDERYLVTKVDGLTNGWGFNSYSPEQYYGRDPTGAHDWFYVNELSGGYTEGIPNAWWARYSLSLTNRAVGNNDEDTANNLEEYIADTDPTNGLSVFGNEVTNMDGNSVMTLQAGPPTTNSRVYDVWWKSNLLENADWMPYDWNVPGDAGGAAVQFSVTNEAGKRFYRTGVKMP